MALTRDPVLVGECLGVPDYRITACSCIPLHDAEIIKKAGMIDFYTMTVKAFKLPLEDRCEDYGQTACYLGGIPDSPQAFVLDDHHTFEKGRHIPVCGNMAMMLEDTRYGDFSTITGNKDTHFGLFDCAPVDGGAATGDSPGACC